MRSSTIIMIGLAGLFGLLAVFVAQSWLTSQAAQMKSHVVKQKPTVTQTVVVAKKPLRFGMQVTRADLKEIPWPKGDIPSGAFHKISLLLNGTKRTVLAPIEVNEPVLAVKVTGPGERASLSALVKRGMKAVTIRVNDAEGGGGFVLPGDRVDVVMTRQLDKGRASSQVVLQDVHVLAVDQSADVRSSKPTVPKAVTLEVSTVEAQKLWLAQSIGKLSLLLRKAGETDKQKTHRITLRDLFGLGEPRSEGNTAKVVVIRGTKKQAYQVPEETFAARAQATVGQSRAR